MKKILSIINSCQTIDQLRNAEDLAYRWNLYYANDKFSNIITIYDAIKRKWRSIK